MKKSDIQALSDTDLMAEWEQVKTAYQLRLPSYLNNHQSLMLFANFVNLSTELHNRKLRIMGAG